MTLLSEFLNAGGFKKASNLALFLELVKSVMPAVSTNNRGEKVLVSANAGSLLVALIFFLIMYLIYRYGLQHGAPNGSPLRAVWMWDNSADDSPKKSGEYDFRSSKVIEDPDDFLSWAKKKGVNQLWLDINAYTGTPAQMIPLLTGAKKQSISVQFMCFTGGSGLYAVNIESLSKIFATIEGIGDKSIWPVAIQSNFEAGLATPKADASEAFKMNTTLKAELEKFNSKHATNIRPVASVFYWWINYEEPNAPVVAGGMSYGEALLKLGFDVTVQDYRIPDFSWSHKPAIAWCKLANLYNRSAHIGMLVGPVKDPLTYPYFDKISSLEGDMKSLAASCTDLEGFAGMAVHDALWYGRYAP